MQRGSCLPAVREDENGEGLFRLLFPVRLLRLLHACALGRVRLQRLFLSLIVPRRSAGKVHIDEERRQMAVSLCFLPP